MSSAGDARSGGPNRLEILRKRVERVATARIRPFTEVPQGADLRRADNVALLRHALPVRPLNPAGLPLWEQFLSPAVRHVPPAIHVETRLRTRALHATLGTDEDTAGSTNPVAAGGRILRSRNWCGGVILPHDSNRFVQVLARWTVPPVKPPAGPDPGPFAMSTWIGVNGFRRWMRSLPQMGTAQHLGDVGDGEPTEFAWIQWWLADDAEQLPLRIDGVPVQQGETVICCLTLLPPGYPSADAAGWVQFNLLNVDTGQATSIVSGPPEGGEVPTPADGASAEWIVERPTAVVASPNGHVQKNDLYPLPDFGTATVQQFVASLAPAPSALLLPTISPATGSDSLLTTGSDPSAQPTGLMVPRLIRMEQVQAGPTRVAQLAVPEPQPDGKLAVHFRG